MRRKDIWAVPKFKNTDFRNDVEAQNVITSREKIKSSRIIRMLILWIVLFFMAIALGFAGFTVGILICMAADFVLIAGMSIYFLYSPAPHCRNCGRKMTRESGRINISGYHAGVFRVCRECRTYVFMHRMMK
jgi:hypothetical protein